MPRAWQGYDGGVLTVGASIDGRFQLHRAVGADAEGEDFLARRLDEPGYARVHVLAADDALRAAVGSAAAMADRIAALDLPGIARPLGAGVHSATGQVWFAEVWTNGSPVCAPDEWDWEDAHSALFAAAALLDPARAHGVVHGRLVPASMLDNLGTTAVVGLAAGAWLDEVRPAGPGGDLGAAARAVRVLIAAPPPAFLAWVARCEQAPPEFGSLAEALAAMPEPGRRWADIDEEQLQAAAQETEREYEENARRWRETHEARIRAGILPPDDLPEQSAAAWPDVFQRVQCVLGASPVRVEESAASGLGLSWNLRATTVASAWPQARGVVRALHALARGGATLGAAASPPRDARDTDRAVTSAERTLLDAVAARLALTPVPGRWGYGPATEWADDHPHDDTELELPVFRGHVGGPRIAAHHGLLEVGPTILGWPTSHMQGPILATQGRMRLADLPRAPAAAADVIAALLRAASAVDLSERTRARTCRFCARQFASVDLHDDSCCHRCAELHLGVIH